MDFVLPTENEFDNQDYFRLSCILVRLVNELVSIDSTLLEIKDILKHRD